MKPKVRFKGFEEDWKENPLGEMGSFSRGQGYSKKDLTDKGKPIFLYGRLYTKYNTFVSDIDTFALEQPNSILSKGIEVVMPSSGETAEDIAIASSIKKEDIILSGGLNIIIPDKDYLNADFLALNLSYGKPHYDLAKRAQGKSVVHLYNSDISSVDLTFPNDLGEQKAIGEYFRKLDGLIRDTGKEIEKLENLKQASLQKMFPQPGESVPQLRFKGFFEPWHEKSLGEISFINKGEQVNKNQLLESGPYYVLNGGIEPSGYFDKFNTKGHTISISEGGNSCGYVFFNEKAFWSGGHNYTVIPNIPDIDNIFLYYFLKGKELDIMSKRVGSGLPNIQRSSLLEYQISFPSSYEEQRAIGDYFRNLDNIISAKKKKLEKLRQVKSSCLNLMFV